MGDRLPRPGAGPAEDERVGRRDPRPDAGRGPAAGRSWSTALRALAFVAFLAGLLFLLAGRWDLPFFWAILGLLAAYSVAVTLLLDPELVRERGDPAAPGPDRYFRALLALFLVIHLAVAALDVGRLHWTDTVPFPLRVAGVVGYAACLILVLRAMRANPFFVPAVRVQEERGHRVVSSGPYGLVRHPGYLGSGAGALCGGLALGSWLAFVPLVGALGALVARTAFEDRFLRARLPGYEEYARQVRYRLAPGIW